MDVKPEKSNPRRIVPERKYPGQNAKKTNESSSQVPSESFQLGSAQELNTVLKGPFPKLGSAKELNKVPEHNNAPPLGSATELNKVPDRPADGTPDLRATRGDLPILNLAGFEISDKVGGSALNSEPRPLGDSEVSFDTAGEKKTYVDFSGAINDALKAAELAEMSKTGPLRAERKDHAWEPPKAESPLKSVLQYSRKVGNAFQSILGGGDPAFHLKAEQKQILALESKYSATDPVTGEYLIPDLSVKTNEFKELLRSGEATLDDIRADAYAVAREASARELGMRHYPVQVLGGLAMDQGSIAEMMTGEGKTLTAVLPLYLNALATDDQGNSKGAHLITVNDTLAERDGEWMRPAFEALGMTLGVVTEEKEPDAKKEAYRSDITYATNNAIGFDYLRDQMVFRPEDRVQRDLHYALVDEVDMVLIDEASTPLILSTGDVDGESDYRNFDRLVKGLKTDGSDFLLSNKEKFIHLTDEGIRYVETHLGFQESRTALTKAKNASDFQQGMLSDVLEVDKAHKKDKALLTNFQENPEDPAKLAEFQQGVKGGAFNFLDKETVNRLKREGPRSADLRRIEKTLANAEEIHNKLIPRLKSKAETAEKTLGKAQNDFEKSELALVKMRAWRAAGDSPEADTLKAEFEKAYAEAPQFNLYDEENMHRVNLMENALKSNYLFHEGEDYLVLDGEVKIVDQFKGRTPAGRRYSNGLHQALEAKEDVVIKTPTRTSASITYPSLFKLYTGSPELRKEPELTTGLAGMSGTALSESREFGEFYGVDVVPIPTNKPVILKKNDTRYFLDQKSKIAAVVDRAETLFKEGKPVLIGTVSVEDNEYVAGQLAKRGIPCQALNAKSVKGSTAEEKAQIHRESQMIANAGNSGMVTVATNMAGRGINIKPDWIAHSKLSRDVMKETQPLGRIASKMEQLLQEGRGSELFVGNEENAKGVSAYFKGEGLNAMPDPKRPGYVTVGGSENRETLEVKNFPPKPAVVDVKDEKELEKLRHWFDISNVPVQVVEGGADAPPPGTVQIRVLPTEASRKDPESYENPTPRAPVPEGVAYFPAENYFTGGLHILATEAHDSPRIDRQLIGRAGRQGAPGEYQFFLSLQDRVLKFFGGEELEEVFHKQAKAEGVDPSYGIVSPKLDKLVEKAQKRVSGLQFDQRAQINEFDKTNDVQRQAFYGMRAGLVDSVDMTPVLQEWTTYHLTDETLQNLPTRILRGWKPEEVADALSEASEELGFNFPIDLGFTEPVKKEQFEKQLGTYIKGLFAESSIDRQNAREEVLSASDDAWANHLVALDLLQTSVNWESVAQQDPKLQYKLRAGEQFQGFVTDLEQAAIRNVVAPALKEAAQKPAFFGSREPLLSGAPKELDRPALTTSKKGSALKADPASYLDAARERGIDLEMLPVESRFWPEARLKQALAEHPTESIFTSYQEESVDEAGRILNPQGSTGKPGKGDFARYGANFRAVPLIMKRDPESQKFQVLTTSSGVLPDGEVEYGESAPGWLLESLFPVTQEGDPKQAIRKRNMFLGELQGSSTLYEGGVEHPDNRDHAWWEIRSNALELEPNFSLPPESGLRWSTVDNSLLENLDPLSRDLTANAVSLYQEATGFKVGQDGTVGRMF